MSIDWPHGMELAPTGERAREFVQRVPVWSSTIWITEHGAAYRRYADGEWHMLEAVLDPSETHIGYNLPGFVSIVTAIATAWHMRAPNSRARAVLLDERRELHVSNVAWNEPDRGAREPESETWSPLRWSIGVLPRIPAGYEISSAGRLRYNGGQPTRGFAMHGTRWAAAKGVGLVNLLAAASIKEYNFQPSPRVFHAYTSFRAGLTPAQHSARVFCPLRQAWANYQLAAPYVDKCKELARVFVDKRLWRDLAAVDDATLRGPLRALRDAVGEVDWDELRLARVCILSSE